MKRGGNLVRKTPLRAKAGLKSNKAGAKSNGVALRASKPQRRASKSTGPKKAVVDLVLARDGYRCVRCGEPVYGERGFDYSIHHRAGRQMGGTKRAAANLPSNLLTLCGSGTTKCHGWVGSNVAEAHRAGLLVLSGIDAKTVVVKTWWADVLLDDEGRWTEVPS